MDEPFDAAWGSRSLKERRWDEVGWIIHGAIELDEQARQPGDEKVRGNARKRAMVLYGLAAVGLAWLQGAEREAQQILAVMQLFNHVVARMNALREEMGEKESIPGTKSFCSAIWILNELKMRRVIQIRRAMDGLSGKIVDLGDFQRIREAGKGSYATVYEVKRIKGPPGEVGNVYAMKCVHPALQASAQKSVVRELEVLCGARQHPTVMRLEGWALQGVGPTERGPVIVMPFADSGSLQQVSDRTMVPLPSLTDRWLILYGVARGMAFVHNTLHLIHRDLKPANVLLVNDGGALRPLIADFGLAKVQAHEAVAVSAAIGSPVYMPPEMLRRASGEEITNKVDVYSFAITMYEVLTMSWAFREYTSVTTLTTAILHGKRPQLVGVGKELKDFVERCWHPIPDKRLSFAAIARNMSDNQGIIPPEVNRAALSAYKAKLDAAEGVGRS